MVKNDFVMHAELLRSVIMEQAGSVVKAIMEAIQNSLDADATKVEIFVNKRGFRIVDNGCGMTPEQIDENFKVFGNSIKKGMKDKRGKFAMGRGQYFAKGRTICKTLNSLMRVNILRYLGYTLREMKETIKGTDITCIFFKPLSYNWEVPDLIKEIKKAVLPLDGVEFYINDEKYELNIEILKTDGDFVHFKTVDEKINYTGRIFSQNLYVKTVSTLFEHNVHCTCKMPTNFARNSFLGDEELTKQLVKSWDEKEKEEFGKIKKFDKTTGKVVMNKLIKRKLDLQKYKKKKIVEMANGKLLSLEQLEKMKNVMYGKKDLFSDKATQQGYTVIDESLKPLMNDLMNQKLISIDFSSKLPREVVVDSFMRKISLEELFKKTGIRTLLYYFYAQKMNEEVFKNERNLAIGESDLALAWTDGYTYIALSKELLNKKQTRREKDMEIFHTLLHEYAHDEDDTNETDHDANFYMRYYELMEAKKSRFGKFIHNYGIKKIEEEFYYKIETIKEAIQLEKQNKSKK